METIAQLSDDDISIKSFATIECSNPRFNLLTSFTEPWLAPYPPEWLPNF
jgi:hypothetical protein